MATDEELRHVVAHLSAAIVRLAAVTVGKPEIEAIEQHCAMALEYLQPVENLVVDLSEAPSRGGT